MSTTATATTLTISANADDGQNLAGATEAFWSAAIYGEDLAPISLDRSIDWLLDLYQTTQEHDLRSLIVDVLEDLGELGSLEGDLEDLVLGALASVEIAFEIKAAA